MSHIVPRILITLLLAITMFALMNINSLLAFTVNLFFATLMVSALSWCIDTDEKDNDDKQYRYIGPIDAEELMHMRLYSRKH